MDHSDKPAPVEIETLGEPADMAMLSNQGLTLNVLVMLARKLTGPFGGFITLQPTEQRAAVGYNLRFYMKENGAGEPPTYNIEVRTPLGKHPTALLRTRG